MLHLFFNKQHQARWEVAFWVILGVLGIASIFLMRYLTPFGMGLVNDSTAYIGGARSMLAGHGYSQLKGNWTYEPITHFPPLLSIILVFFGFLGLEAIRAIRLVNILLFAVNTILTALAVRKLTGSRSFAIVGAIFFMCSSPFLSVHSFALSEPLFLCLFYMTLLLLTNYLQSTSHLQEKSKSWLWLAGAGLFTSLAYLTRYVGVSLYATSLLALLVFNNSWSRRIKDILIFLAFSLPGTAAWSLRNILVSGNAANRPISWHPISPEKWFEGLRNFWGWLLPDIFNLVDTHLLFLGIMLVIILVTIAIIVGFYIIRYLRHKILSNSHQIAMVIFTVQGLVYLTMLIIAMSFFDDKTIFEHRMLAPFYVSTLILIISCLAWLNNRPHIIEKVTSVILILALLGTFIKDGIDISKTLHSTGQGYASGRWRNSETIEAVKDLPQIKIFSNKITALYILADRPGYVIPWRFTQPGEPDPTYDQGVKEYQNQVMNREAVVVIFDYEEEVASGNERVVDITNGLPVLGMYTDGAVFGLPVE